jgi:glycerol kinase
MPELLLALDAGTTTLRACLFTPGGDLVARAARSIASAARAPGRVEQDAAALWDGAQAVIAEVLGARDAGAVAAIGVTSQRASAMLWDRATGAPLTPLVVWSDLRGAARAAQLQAQGFPIVPQQAAAKLEAIAADAPDAPALMRAGRLAYGNIDAFLIFKLTGGVHATDRSQAWPSGYLDLTTLGWNEGLIALQHLDAAIFPTLVDTWGPIGATDPSLFGAAIPITAVIADQQSALIAEAGEAAGGSKATFGTSATLNVSTGDAFVYRGASIPPFILSCVGGQARFCVEGMVYTAGAALDWLRTSFGLGDHSAFAALAARNPASEGVAFLPALQGLGAPHGDMSRRAALVGLSLASGPGPIARAGIEGVAFRVREAFDHIYAETGLTPPEALRVDGGLTASDALMQAQADILARPVARCAIREATAAGAAICAGRGAGLLGAQEIGGFARIDRTFEPAWGADEARDRLAAWRTQVYR